MLKNSFYQERQLPSYRYSNRSFKKSWSSLKYVQITTGGPAKGDDMRSYTRLECSLRSVTRRWSVQHATSDTPLDCAARDQWHAAGLLEAHGQILTAWKAPAVSDMPSNKSPWLVIRRWYLNRLNAAGMEPAGGVSVGLLVVLVEGAAVGPGSTPGQAGPLVIYPPTLHTG